MTESNPNPPSAPEASLVKRQRPWWVKLLRWGSLGLASLVTLLVLVLVLDSWRGQRAWQKYRTEMEAKGAIFDLKGMIPPSVPDEENFAMTPLLKPVMQLDSAAGRPPVESPTNWLEATIEQRVKFLRIHGPEPTFQHLPNGNEIIRSRNEFRDSLPELGNWQLGRATDLVQWQHYYRAVTNFPSPSQSGNPADDVITALSLYDVELTELSEASRRPFARFDIDYLKEPSVAILLPHLANLKGIAQVAALRASAELALGQAERALEDIQIALRMSDSISAEPILISHLVRLSVLNAALGPVWEGIVEHRWNEAQLRQFDSHLAGMDLIAELQHCMKGERCFGNDTLEWLIRHPQKIAALGEIGGGGAAQVSIAAIVLGKLVPKGWLRFEQLNYNRLFDDSLLNHLPESAAGLDVASLQSAAATTTGKLKEKHPPFKAITSHHVFAQLMLPALEKASLRSVNYQAMLNQARLALALERHWLARGTYPETLEKLVPEFVSVLPPDPVNHKPLGYSRVGESGFKLWSIGWNLKDDGGQVVMKSGSTEAIDFERGDWVWPALAVGD